MYNTAYGNTEVLDVMAEVVLEKYPMAGEQFTYVDSVAWMCRALGASGNVRYRPVLEKVAEPARPIHPGLAPSYITAARPHRMWDNPGSLEFENGRTPFRRCCRHLRCPLRG